MKNSFIRALSLGLLLAFPATVMAQQAAGEKPTAEKKEKKSSKKAKAAEGAEGGAAAGEKTEKAEKAEKKGKKSKADKAAGEGAAKP